MKGGNSAGPRSPSRLKEEETCLGEGGRNFYKTLEEKEGEKGDRC